MMREFGRSKAQSGGRKSPIAKTYPQARREPRQVHSTDGRPRSIRPWRNRSPSAAFAAHENMHEMSTDRNRAWWRRMAAQAANGALTKSTYVFIDKDGRRLDSQGIIAPIDAGNPRTRKNRLSRRLENGEHRRSFCSTAAITDVDSSEMAFKIAGSDGV